jgi:MoaA/NifB/PqqE/SkfB family radical SAM enzyme
MCPRSCSYCLSKDVRGDGTFLSPEQWADGLHILEYHGVQFHLFIGNELFSYSDPVGFVKAIKPFYGRYGIYSTFPPGWTEKYFDDCINAGLYNISGGVDVLPGLHKTGDVHIDRKARAVLSWLEYALMRGVPDVQAQITIHRHNYDKLYPLLDLCTEKGMWVGCSLVEASADGLHDFYGTADTMTEWLIPADERNKFSDEMYKLADEVATGRWKMQLPPTYFRELADREVRRDPWHCSLPMLISIEEDGSLRGCGYRGPLSEKYSIFDLREGGKLPMSEYIRLQREKTSQCPGCGVGGGAWSFWWMAEYWLKGDVAMGDRIFQTHAPGHLFEATVRQDEQ